MDMTGISILQLIVNFATLLTLIIYLLTLIEMRKQRFASTQPDIVIESFQFFFLSLNLNSDNKLHGCPYIWRTNRINLDLNREHHYINPACQIDLLNIGIGTAKNISYQWDFDIEYYMSLFASYNTSIECTFNNDYFGQMMFFTQNSLTQVPGIHDTNNQFTHLSPSNKYKITFCEVYTYIFSSYLYFIAQTDWANNINILEVIEKLPPLILTLKYSDLSGKIYTKKYQFSFNISSFSQPEISLHTKFIGL